MSPELSILIITYNRPDLVLDLLDNLRLQDSLTDHVLEILVLNNASTSSYEPVENFLRAHPDLPVQLINNPVNAGVAGGRNILIRRARGAQLLVLDDDVLLPDAHAICRIAGLFDQPRFREHNTAVITLNIHYYETKAPQVNAFPHKQYEAYRDKPWFLTYYFIGAAHLMRRELFTHTGYYPEDFFYGMEEYDLGYRILNAGYTIAYDASVVVWHKESPAGRMLPREKHRMMWLNKSKMTWRYLPLRYFCSTTLIWSLRYLVKGGWDLRGFFRTLGEIRRFCRQERRTPVNRGVLAYLRRTKARLWY